MFSLWHMVRNSYECCPTQNHKITYNIMRLVSPISTLATSCHKSQKFGHARHNSNSNYKTISKNILGQKIKSQFQSTFSIQKWDTVISIRILWNECLWYGKWSPYTLSLKEPGYKTILTENQKNEYINIQIKDWWQWSPMQCYGIYLLAHMSLF